MCHCAGVKAFPAPGRLASVNLAVVRTGDWVGDKGRTGIDKRPTDGPVRVADHRVIGDSVCDEQNHGGPDQAVYAFAREDAAYWEAELQREVRPGAFGENFSTEGVDVTGAVIGERWAIGTAVFEVSCPRIPCRVFAGFWGVPDLIKRFTQHGVSGAYLRIVTEGEVRAGDTIEVVHRPEHGVTIGETFRALTIEPSLLPRLLDVPELPAQDQEVVRRRLGLSARPA